ncbi:unnamed protein product [Cylicocyclus nassatus]|uniref:Uncharacterized protein n=1 Tax=Cylicocyclus nassatus TaxID=53992 RepID=A0AA36DUX4_CYLNA|nr:unnamed protein product [Cylicocyclus nassatus]
MPAATKWREAFKEIYGKTPTKSDYQVAPKVVKEEYFAEHPPTPNREEQAVTHVKSGVRLKRPADDDSPLKQRPTKARRLYRDQTPGLRTSPRKSVQARNNRELSLPTSPSTTSRTPRGRALAALREIQSTSLQSPSQPKFASPIKRLQVSSGFSSLFDTPEKGKPAIWGEPSPQKALNPPSTPIRSPRKPLMHKEVLVNNAECLLLPTPEKRSKPEEMKPFEPEIVALKKTLAGVHKKDTATAFDPTTGKVVKRAFKRSAPNAGMKRKKEEKGNFVRINMKKKSFAKGKVSAEQKRKMRRKQNWKKRFGGGRG